MEHGFKFISNLCLSDTEVIVNAANAKGWMGGFIGKFIRLKGFAESLHYVTHGKLEKLAKSEAKRVNAMAGDVFITVAMHPLKSRFIYHACTMNKPGQRSSLKTVELCILRLLAECKKNEVEAITIPMLGCGTGGLNYEDVIKLYENHFIGSGLQVTICHPTLTF